MLHKSLVPLCIRPLLLFLFWSYLSQSGMADEPLSAEVAGKLRGELESLQSRLSTHSRTRDWADAAIFAKGVTWGLDYDKQFSPSDVALLQKALQRGAERESQIGKSPAARTTRRGKVALGYVSQVDGSVQPYGLIVPRSYDPQKAIRLDVVLHGSSRPVGMSELRFINRFDEGDDESTNAPDAPYIELHPLGRVENCYRWSGETDVFEAIEDVCQRYNIDRSRIVLRGMSMGASGTWHLGLKHPDRFAALGPYCGYVDTHKFSETPIPGFVKVGPLPPHQELGLHMLDSVDYAANVGVVPAIACMGEKDVFFQAHEIMKEAMQREGLTMVNLISPGTGHVIDPVTHAQQLEQIATHVAKGKRYPADLRFVTWTLKYNRCHWLEILQLEQHYARAEFSAHLINDTLQIDVPKNIAMFAIHKAELPPAVKAIKLGEALLPLEAEQGSRMIGHKSTEGWKWISEQQFASLAKQKSPGQQGPIDDAFATRFLCVRGTGKAWNPAVQAYADAALQRFSAEWRQFFRGELPLKNDTEVTADDLQNCNLILFGDPGSNPWIAKSLTALPIEWTKETLRMNSQAVNAANHLPALIAPSPFSAQKKRYIVLNSGHTFRDAELNKFNYLLFPRWGDWALLQIHDSPNQPAAETVLQAGYFNESWQFPGTQ